MTAQTTTTDAKPKPMTLKCGAGDGRSIRGWLASVKPVPKTTTTKDASGKDVTTTIPLDRLAWTPALDPVTKKVANNLYASDDPGWKSSIVKTTPDETKAIVEAIVTLANDEAKAEAEAAKAKDPSAPDAKPVEVATAMAAWIGRATSGRLVVIALPSVATDPDAKRTKRTRVAVTDDDRAEALKAEVA